MIYKLRRRLVVISATSVLAVVLTVFVVMTVLNVISMNDMLDTTAAKVSHKDGRFPESSIPPGGEIGHPPEGTPTSSEPGMRFAAHHFTVWLSESGEVARVNTEFIYSVDEETAVSYARIIASGNSSRGWINGFRYNLFDENGERIAVFVDGSLSISQLVKSMLISAIVLLSCGIVIILLIALLSDRAVKPVAESYDKQKQFITDAGHELKTPLTLILANLDIAEMELGQNEWLDDIRAEGNRMAELVSELTALSRMDEGTASLSTESIDLSDIVSESVAAFSCIADSRGKSLSSDISDGETVNADEAMIRRLVSILLDNAVKYCDDGGNISVILNKRTLTVENSFSGADELQYSRLFDRFYRADKARKKGGFGIGLSIAKAICDQHGAQISAQKAADQRVAFKVVFK